MLKHLAGFAVLAMALLDRTGNLRTDWGKKPKGNRGRRVSAGADRVNTRTGGFATIGRFFGGDAAGNKAAESPRQAAAGMSVSRLNDWGAGRSATAAYDQGVAAKKARVKKRAATKGAQAKRKRAPAKSSTSRKKSTTTTGTTPSKPVRKRKTNPSNRKVKPVQARAKTAQKKVKARSKSTRTRAR